MPTVLRYRSYRVFFFSNETSEPPHVHVESGDGYAKFWLEPVAAVTWVGFGPRDLRRIQRILNLHKADILERVGLSDGREIAAPLAWFPRLRAASPEERAGWRLIGGGVGVHWDAIDEDLSVAGLLAG